MGQEEEAATPMARARFSRCEQARLCRVAQGPKACRDLGKSQREVPFDILAKDPPRLRLGHDAPHFRPEMPRVALSASSTGETEGLAWIAGRDEMNAVAPRAAVEGSEIVPDKRLSQGLVFHPRHESCRSMGLPLDESHSPISGLGDVQPEVETSIACTERDASKVARLRCEAGT